MPDNYRLERMERLASVGKCEVEAYMELRGDLYFCCCKDFSTIEECIGEVLLLYGIMD